MERQFLRPPALYPILKRAGPRFGWSDLAGDVLFKAVEHEACEHCPWLQGVRTALLEDRVDDARLDVLKAFFVTGLVGCRPSEENAVVYSSERLWRMGLSELTEATFTVHPMFHGALCYIDKGPDANAPTLD